MNNIDIYYKDLKHVQILSNEECIKLLKKSKQGDIKARNLLVESCMKLIFKKIYFYKNHWTFPSLKTTDLEDLVQDASLHVIEIINKWNPEKGKLTTIVGRWIKNRFIKTFTQYDKYSLIRIPQRTQENCTSLDKIDPRKLFSYIEIQNHLNVGKVRAQQIQNARKCRIMTSFVPFGIDDKIKELM